MGIAGVALLGAIFSIIQSIRMLIAFFSWHNKQIVDAEIGEVLKTEHLGKKSERYTFSVTLDTSPEKTVTEYETYAESYDKLPFKTGDTVKVYYDPTKEDKKQFQVVSRLKSDLWGYPLIAVVCIAVFIGCVLLVK